jgi:hypothetical protein
MGRPQRRPKRILEPIEHSQSRILSAAIDATADVTSEFAEWAGYCDWWLSGAIGITRAHQTANLKPRIDRFALQRQNAEDALVHSPQRFSPHESLQGFDSQREFSDRQRPLTAEASVSQSRQMLIGRIVGAVNDAEVFRSAALNGRLHQPLLTPRDKIQRLDYHSLTTAVGESAPPGDALLFACRYGDIDRASTASKIRRLQRVEALISLGSSLMPSF